MAHDEFRRAIKGADVHRLTEVNAALFAAYGAGGLTDDQFEQLSALLEARRTVGAAAPARAALRTFAGQVARVRAPSRTGSRPRSADSIARRRR